MSLYSTETTAYIPPVTTDVESGNERTDVFDYQQLREFVGDTLTEVIEPVGSDADTVDLPHLSGRIYDPGLHRRTEFVDPEQAIAAEPTAIDFKPLQVTDPTELALARMIEYSGCVRAEGAITLITHSYSY